MQKNKCSSAETVHHTAINFKTITVQRRRIWQGQPSTTISFEEFPERKARFQPAYRHCRTNSNSFGSVRRNAPRSRHRRP